MRFSGALPPVVLAFLFMIAGGLPSVSQTTAAEMLQLNAATALKAGQNGHFIVRAEINGRNCKSAGRYGRFGGGLSYEDAEELAFIPAILTIIFRFPPPTAW